MQPILVPHMSKVELMFGDIIMTIELKLSQILETLVGNNVYLTDYVTWPGRGF